MSQTTLGKNGCHLSLSAVVTLLSLFIHAFLPSVPLVLCA